MQNGQNRCLIMRSARVRHYKRISTPLSEQIVVSAEEIWIEIQKNVFPREQQPSCIGEIRNDQVSSLNILPAPKWKKVLLPLYLKFRQGKHNHLVNLDMISPRADLLRQTEKTAIVYRPLECRTEYHNYSVVRVRTAFWPENRNTEISISFETNTCTRKITHRLRKRIV